MIVSIQLGTGINLAECIASTASRVPEGVYVYPGDSQSVPGCVKGSSDDLIVNVKDKRISVVHAAYYDPICGVWIAQLMPDELILDESRSWMRWVGYLKKVIPYKSDITIDVLDV